MDDFVLLYLGLVSEIDQFLVCVVEVEFFEEIDEIETYGNFGLLSQFVLVVLSLRQYLFLQTFLDIGTGVGFISQREQPFYCWKNLYSDVIGLHILVELVKEADDFLRGYFLRFQEELEPLFEETGLYIIVYGFDVCQDFVADVLEDVLVVFWFIFDNELG